MNSYESCHRKLFLKPFINAKAPQITEESQMTNKVIERRKTLGIVAIVAVAAMIVASTPQLGVQSAYAQLGGTVVGGCSGYVCSFLPRPTTQSTASPQVAEPGNLVPEIDTDSLIQQHLPQGDEQVTNNALGAVGTFSPPILPNLLN